MYEKNKSYNLAETSLGHDTPPHQGEICAKLFGNPSQIDEVPVRTCCFTPDFDI